MVTANVSGASIFRDCRFFPTRALAALLHVFVPVMGPVGPASHRHQFGLALNLPVRMTFCEPEIRRAAEEPGIRDPSTRKTFLLT